jgi:hypothetical protein
MLHGEKTEKNEIEGKRLRQADAGKRIDCLWYDKISDETHGVDKRCQEHHVTNQPIHCC